MQTPTIRWCRKHNCPVGMCLPVNKCDNEGDPCTVLPGRWEIIEPDRDHGLSKGLGCPKCGWTGQPSVAVQVTPCPIGLRIQGAERQGLAFDEDLRHDFEVGEFPKGCTACSGRGFLWPEGVAVEPFCKCGDPDCDDTRRTAIIIDGEVE